MLTLKVECGKLLEKERPRREAGQSQTPHPFVKQTLKRCGTQEPLIALRVLHPSFDRETA